MKPTTFALGILTLIALQVLVTTPATGYLGALINVPAGLLKKLIDPTVPLLGSSSAPIPRGLTGPNTGQSILPLVPSAQNSLGR